MLKQKVAQVFQKFTKKSPNQFDLKAILFTTTQKVTNHLGYFEIKCAAKKSQKSGHTGNDPQATNIIWSDSRWNNTYLYTLPSKDYIDRNEWCHCAVRTKKLVSYSFILTCRFFMLWIYWIGTRKRLIVVLSGLEAVRPEKNRQMYIKAAQKWFH